MKLTSWISFVLLLFFSFTATISEAAGESLPAEQAEQTSAAVPAPTNLYDSHIVPHPTSEIDRIVFVKLASLGVEPILCSDAVFVRRAFLDVIGTLPTAAEAKEFIDDKSPDKRATLIDRLLERHEFADYWSMKWGDVLRIKAEFPVNLWPNAAQAYHRWVRASIVDNKPYDQFARELLTSSGSNYRVPAVNFYRAIQNKTPEGIAATVALTLMGSRTDNWPADRRAGTSIFFSQIGYKPTAEWKEEIVFWDPLGISKTASSIVAGSDAPSGSAQTLTETLPLQSSSAIALKSRDAVLPDGKEVKLSSDQDPREVFADWLITKDNPWFAKNMVNRVWAWLMGRGIVEPADDIREDNPPVSAELLAYLEKEFVASGYDLRQLYRLILKSQVYQFSSTPRGLTAEAESNFAVYRLRPPEAEVLIDAINAITGTSDLYTSAIPEPYTYIPEDMPAVAIADGSITSSFLTLFGRSARATGMLDERNVKPVSSQSLHMLNSSHIQEKLEKGKKLNAIFAVKRRPEETLSELYLTILSREPSDEEIAKAMKYPQKTGRFTRPDWIDIAWALINSPEFLYRH